MKLTDDDRARLIEILIAHQRLDAGACACGWGELGRSFAEHVVTAFEESELPARERTWLDGPVLYEWRHADGRVLYRLMAAPQSDVWFAPGDGHYLELTGWPEAVLTVTYADGQVFTYEPAPQPPWSPS